jgi:hypothetical protein
MVGVGTTLQFLNSLSLLEWAGILIATFYVVTAAGIASGRGRNPVWWGLMGLLFGLIAIIVVLCLKSRTRTGIHAASSGEWGRW